VLLLPPAQHEPSARCVVWEKRSHGWMYVFEAAAAAASAAAAAGFDSRSS
jgi:hypothetical protein